MNHSSRIYKELQHDEIVAIIHGAGYTNAEQWTYALLGGGLFNTTYLLHNAGLEQKVVLRVGPIHLELLMDFEKTMMSAEPSIYRLLASQHIPVPQVIKMDDSREIIDRTYMLMECVPGVPMNHASVPEEAKSGIRKQVGHYLSLMHRIQGEQFGWPMAEGKIRGHLSWAVVLMELVEEMIGRLRINGLFEEEELAAMEAVFQSLERSYEAIKTPCLVHNDLWDPNVLVDSIEGQWKVTAIIDVDRAIFADPEFEYILWGQEASLMEGYGRLLDPSPEAKQRRESYYLLLCIMNTYVHRIEYDDLLSYEQSREETLRCLQQIRGV